ncbi:nickel-dependent hydrogenase large subunit [Sulfurimonas sp. CS5]|uniref:nickel-dependent hydrogenase large subunit n=1 Tax=Sulfurimonas sp. CS5 TaxID=3391145 RepID=UPI0039E93998
MIELIEKIEGEAKLDFSFEDGKIDFVDIEFMTARNIEKILKGKSPLDALVINPRVCGICGHAHLIATVQALEDCYENLEISNKAKIIRELTLTFELIQNHFKWFYLTMRPLFGEKQEVLKATYPSQLMAKAIAVFGGQYPHTSYAIVGGVVCDVTEVDIIKVKHYIEEAIKFFETNVVQADTKDFLVCDNVDKVLKKSGDLPDILKGIKKKKYLSYGKTYDRFIAFGENSYFTKGKSHKTIATHNISIDYVKEYTNPNSLAKNVMYKDKYYEVGPLARAMINKVPLVKDAHRRYGDNIFSRIIARVCEIPQLLNHSKELLEQLDISEPSYIEPLIDITQVNGSGESAVEAARGSLIHKVDIENGVIKNYEIITPTQWNLGNGTKENLGVSQKAMIGLEDVKTAELVFKTFDVCSVCTTH